MNRPSSINRSGPATPVVRTPSRIRIPPIDMIQAHVFANAELSVSSPPFKLQTSVYAELWRWNCSRRQCRKKRTVALMKIM
ncbi:hypothetical protein HAX54_053354, partial [Datura stramonium]|nr:hypothetical protein [Datura stramonium]